LFPTSLAIMIPGPIGIRLNRSQQFIGMLPPLIDFDLNFHRMFAKIAIQYIYQIIEAFDLVRNDNLSGQLPFEP